MSYIQLHYHLIAKKATKTNSCSKLKSKYSQQLMFDHFFQEFGEQQQAQDPTLLLMFQLWKNATEKKAMDCEDDEMESKEIEEE